MLKTLTEKVRRYLNYHLEDKVGCYYITGYGIKKLIHIEDDKVYFLDAFGVVYESAYIPHHYKNTGPDLRIAEVLDFLNKIDGGFNLSIESGELILSFQKMKSSPSMVDFTEEEIRFSLEYDFLKEQSYSCIRETFELCKQYFKYIKE